MGAPTKESVDRLLTIHDSYGAEFAREKAGVFDTTRTWVDPAGHRLSDRVWDAKQDTRKQIDEVLQSAVANREDALVTSKKLEQFLNPAYAAKRDQTGKLVKGQRRGIVTSAPGRGGQGSYPARRLARTEISRAHAQATDLAVSTSPFATGWGWNVSGSHPKVDECDQHAQADNGLGPGIYRPGLGPRMPAHPMCLCYKTIEHLKDDKAIVDQLRKEYGLDALTDVPKWSPVMTETQAKAWAKANGSKVADETFYHFTGENAANLIAKNGLKSGNGGVWGRGIYSTSQDLTSGTGIGADLSFKVVGNAKNPLRIAADDFHDTIKALRSELKLPDAELFDLLEKKGYDAVVVDHGTTGTYTGKWLMVRDTEQAVLTDVFRVSDGKIFRSEADLFELGARDPKALAKILEEGGIPKDALDYFTGEAPDFVKAFQEAKRAETLVEPVAKHVPWKPSMSPEEAAEWAKDGFFKDRTFYHFTDSSAVDSIMKTGLRVNPGIKGDFVYSTSLPLEGGATAARSTGELLKLKTNVKNPFIGTEFEMSELQIKWAAQTPTEALAKAGHDAWLKSTNVGSEWLMVPNTESFVTVGKFNELDWLQTRPHTLRTHIENLNASGELSDIEYQRLRSTLNGMLGDLDADVLSVYNDLQKVLGNAVTKVDDAVRLAKEAAEKLAKEAAEKQVVKEPSFLPNQPPSTYKKVTSQAEAKKRLDEMGINYFNVPDDLRIFNNVMEPIWDAQKAGFNFGKTRLEFVKNVQKSDLDTFAFVRGNDTGPGRFVVNIDPQNAKVWSGADTKALQKLNSSKFLVGDSPYDLVMHELAHVQHGRSFEFKNLLLDARLPTKFKAQIKKELSTYASSEPVEFVAEAYVKMMKTGERLSPDLMDLYHQYGGPLPKFKRSAGGLK